MSGSEERPAVALALSPHHCGKGVKITWLPIAEDECARLFFVFRYSSAWGEP